MTFAQPHAKPIRAMRDRIAGALAGVGGRRAEEEDVASYALLIASLFSSPTSLLLSNVVATLVAVFCWRVTEEPAFAALGACAGIIVVLRARTIVLYRRWRPANPTLAELRRWDRAFMVGATAFAVTVGLTCFTALAFTHSIPSHIITIVLGIAFSSGYVARNAARPSFVILQLLCFCGPMAAGLAIADELHYSVIAWFIALYIATNVSIVFSLNRNLLALAAATKEAKALAGTLQQRNVTLDTAINSMTLGLAMFDAAGRLEVHNRQFEALHRIDPPAAKGEDASALVARLAGRLSAGDAGVLRDRLAVVLRSGTAEAFEIRTVDGLTFAIRVEPTPGGGILMLTEDATIRKATAAQIEYMAAFDGLTGLANRFTFNAALARACDPAGPEGGRAAVLYVDVDNFKGVNDTLGHEIGDALLRQAAARLRATCPPQVLLARFGGDEFVLLLPDATGAEGLAQAICAAFAEPFAIGARQIPVTVSVGLALWPEHGRAPQEVVSAADMALYAAKAAGRNRVAVFARSMAQDVERRRALEVELRATRDGRDLELHYQPLIDLTTGSVLGFEALMRWRHPSKGMIPPSDFIPLAEQTGLIAEIGEWALRRACADAAAWPSEATVAVNVSALQFRDAARLVRAVRRALTENRLPGRRLELEVTESVLIDDPETTLKALRSLRKLGVRVSLDDFGTGFSSLAYLARYPFSKVKIDRSFAQAVTRDHASRAVIEAVCGLGRRLGLRVVVEGIETEEQLEALRALGAEQGQGYLFGRPAPVGTLSFAARAAA